MKEGWEYRKFESCLVKVPKQVQVKSKEYKKTGRFPIVSQESELISGYWDDETIVYKHNKPIIIFGDHTKNIKYIDFDFAVGADGTHILSTKDDIIAKYFFYALKSVKLRNLGYARHYKLLKEKYIPVPPLSEQQRIVDYLDSAFAKIDAMKANAEKQLNEARALFQASLKEMLEPKEGWEEKSLGDFAYMKAGDFIKASEIHSEYQEGLFPCYGGNGLRGYVKVPNQEGDFCMIGRQGALCGCINRAKGVFRTTERAVIVKPYNPIPTDLVYYLLVRLNLNKYATGAAQPGLSVNHIAEVVRISIPPLSEQQSIVATLDTLKSKVDRLQSNFEKISQECSALKQALLRKVFD